MKVFTDDIALLTKLLDAGQFINERTTRYLETFLARLKAGRRRPHSRRPVSLPRTARDQARLQVAETYLR